MIACRLVKLAMVASIALFAFVVTFDNIVDYQSNYDFVRHVLSMGTTFPGNALRPGRAVAAPRAWIAAYWIIIGVEGFTGAAFAVAAAAPISAFSYGSPGSWWSAASASPCGNQKSGTDRKRHSAAL